MAGRPFTIPDTSWLSAGLSAHPYTPANCSIAQGWGSPARLIPNENPDREQHHANTNASLVRPSPAIAMHLARHYHREGLAEHASVASFARFSLQLMAVGAPVRLLEAASLAAVDEVRHTRQCFTAAAMYEIEAGVQNASHSTEPGPFPLTAEAMALAVSVGDLARATAVEVLLMWLMATRPLAFVDL